jgi:hypothetical protein
VQPFTGHVAEHHALRFVSDAVGWSSWVLTLAETDAELAGAWPVLRLPPASGRSAVVFVTSGWCMSQLAQRGVPAMGGLDLCGDPAGIV